MTDNRSSNKRAGLVKRLRSIVVNYWAFGDNHNINREAADEIERLHAALTWCLKDSYWMHRENAFESDEPKPTGVLETLEEVRRELYPAIAEVSSG